MADVVMTAPPDSGGATWQGQSFTVSRGKMRVPVEAVNDLAPFGFTVADGQESVEIPDPEPTAPVVAPPPTINDTAVQ